MIMLLVMFRVQLGQLTLCRLTVWSVRVYLPKLGGAHMGNRCYQRCGSWSPKGGDRVSWVRKCEFVGPCGGRDFTRRFRGLVEFGGERGIPVGITCSRDVGSAAAVQELRKSAGASKRKRVAEQSPAELDAFSFALAREYLRGFPSADFGDTLDRIITESYALEQWRFDHEVRRPIRPLVPGRVPSAAGCTTSGSRRGCRT